ncbi:MAG: hypothetical protein R2838_17730 [Caldilineaceae bacterium]
MSKFGTFTIIVTLLLTLAGCAPVATPTDAPAAAVDSGDAGDAALTPVTLGWGTSPTCSLRPSTWAWTGASTPTKASTCLWTTASRTTISSWWARTRCSSWSAAATRSCWGARRGCPSATS